MRDYIMDTTWIRDKITSIIIMKFLTWHQTKDLFFDLTLYHHNFNISKQLYVNLFSLFIHEDFCISFICNEFVAFTFSSEIFFDRCCNLMTLNYLLLLLFTVYHIKLLWNFMQKSPTPKHINSNKKNGSYRQTHLFIHRLKWSTKWSFYIHALCFE